MMSVIMSSLEHSKKYLEKGVKLEGEGENLTHKLSE